MARLNPAFSTCFLPFILLYSFTHNFNCFPILSSNNFKFQIYSPPLAPLRCVKTTRASEYNICEWRDSRNLSYWVHPPTIYASQVSKEQLAALFRFKEQQLQALMDTLMSAV